MKIAINAAFFRPKDIGGSGVYLERLVPKLLEIDGDLEIILFALPEALARFADSPRLKKYPLPRSDRFHRRIYHEQVLIPRMSKALGAQAILSAGTSGPLSSSLPHITVLHDLQHLHYPQYFGLKTKAFRRTFWEGAMKRADAVIAISEFTKDDLTNEVGIDAGKIHVIHHGAKIAEPPADVLDDMSARTPQPFIFMPGRTYPHKGHAALIRAFELIAPRIPHHLVFCGAPDRAHGEVTSMIDASVYRTRIRHLGQMSGAEVAALFRLADILAFPSEFEGFGLPLIEAMAVGCPVVATDAASIPEVAGDAAMLVPPRDHAALAEAILKVLTDSRLREKLVARGKARAGEFTWERCARRTLEVIRHSANAQPRRADTTTNAPSPHPSTTSSTAESSEG